MSDLVKIIECPRDAWQGLKEHVPARTKAHYLRRLIEAGFRHIDAASFVSAAAVPQMADSEEALAMLGPVGDVEIIGIVLNARGAERAIGTGAVRTLGFPYSVSAEFLRRNQNQTMEEAFTILGAISALAQREKLGLVAYVSMGFGNPYGEDWSIGSVVKACEKIAALGVREISLADTVGLATPVQIRDVVGQVLAACREVEIGVHLHARPEQAPEKISAAYGAGCRRFDGALGGLGGCPFAQDSLVGNIPTEMLITSLQALGAQLPALSPLDALLGLNGQFASTPNELNAVGETA
jgi:hydroxymethylglutaryl-CoA lyase